MFIKESVCPQGYGASHNPDLIFERAKVNPCNGIQHDFECMFSALIN